eukprot:s818_g2.t1
MMLKPEAGRVLQLGSSGLAIATLPGAPSSLRRSTMATSAWSLRDVLAVIFIFVCFCFAWLVSMGQNLFLLHYPDREYAQQKLVDARGPLDDTFLGDVQRSYWGPRWLWFAPHVFSSIVWWNFAWIQLIKYIRANHIWLHRLNGRIQVTAMMGQIITGIGLASGSPTHGVKMMSTAYGLAMAYVLANTIYYVRKKDIVRHKYWATKLFGYSQAIALQRVYYFSFLASTLLGESPFWAVAPSSSLEQRNFESRDIRPRASGVSRQGCECEERPTSPSAASRGVKEQHQCSTGTGRESNLRTISGSFRVRRFDVYGFRVLGILALRMRTRIL